MTPRIAVIGAGPAGLTFARLLQVADVDVIVTVFEHDPSPTSRKFQGGTLDLHTHTGLAALKKADLWQESQKHLRYDAQELTITDPNATVLIHRGDANPVQGKNIDYERPEMDRETLKDMLLASVKTGQVQWGKVLQSINSDTGILNFRDGSTAGPFDLVVGADGAWSKVRPVLTDIRPRYSGVCGLEGHIKNADQDHPNVTKMVGRGSYFVYGDHKMLSGQRMGDESLKMGFWIKEDERYFDEMIAACGGDEAKIREKMLESFAKFAPELREWIQVSGRFRPWPLYELPVGHTWQHKKGYTLIGDAASLMTPFAGEGVNKAMKDSLELAEAIERALKDKTNLDDAVASYEKNMFPRAEKIQGHTMASKTAAFGEGGAVAMIVGKIDFIAEEMGLDLYHGWLSWVPIKTFAYCWLQLLRNIGRCRRTLRETIFSKQR